MRRIILIDSFYPINSRNKRIVNSIALDPDNDIDVVCWDRDSLKTKPSDSYHIYSKCSPRGNKLRKLYDIIGFYRYIKSILSKKEYDLIIASHWDMLICATLLKSKRQVLVYDNLDIPTSTNTFIRKILFFLERCCLSNVSLMILASRFYEGLYKNKHSKLAIRVVENLPSSLFCNNTDFSVDNTPLRVFFIGTIRYYEILTNLCDAVGNDSRFELSFYGDGQDLEKLKEYAKDYGNIFFNGYFDHAELSRIYSSCDIVWAAYPNKDFNVKYAISNKFFDSIFSCIPTIFSNKTCLGDYVDAHDIGFTVDPYDIDSIKDLLISLYSNRTILIETSRKLRSFQNNEVLWDEAFSSILSDIKLIQTDGYYRI